MILITQPIATARPTPFPTETADARRKARANPTATPVAAPAAIPAASPAAARAADINAREFFAGQLFGQIAYPERTVVRNFNFLRRG